jgi:hypothetical protein
MSDDKTFYSAFIEGLRIEVREGMPENMLAFYVPGTPEKFESYTEFDPKNPEQITFGLRIKWLKPPQVVVLKHGD